MSNTISDHVENTEHVSQALYHGVGFHVAQMVKNLPAVQETWVESLGREDPLENGMTTHSSVLAWKIPWTEELSRLQSTGLKSQTRLRDCETLSLSYHGDLIIVIYWGIKGYQNIGNKNYKRRCMQTEDRVAGRVWRQSHKLWLELLEKWIPCREEGRGIVGFVERVLGGQATDVKGQRTGTT